MPPVAHLSYALSLCRGVAALLSLSSGHDPSPLVICGVNCVTLSHVNITTILVSTRDVFLDYLLSMGVVGDLGHQVP